MKKTNFTASGIYAPRSTIWWLEQRWLEDAIVEEKSPTLKISCDFPKNPESF